MGNLGTAEMIGVILYLVFFIYFLKWLFGKSKKITSSLVLTEFTIENLEISDTLVNLKGRQSGLISFILTTLKLEPIASLLVTKQKIHFHSNSLSGEDHIVVSLKNSVSSVYCNYYRPISYLVFGAVFTIICLLASIGTGTVTGFFIAIFLDIILVLAFYFNKSIIISIETIGGEKFGLRFKPSLIENINLDIEKARQVIEIINNQIITLQAH